MSWWETLHLVTWWKRLGISAIKAGQDAPSWIWCTWRFSFLGGSLSFYSVSCMDKVMFNPSLLNWSSHILTVAHIYILNTYIILLHFVFNLCAPSCERFTCKRFWMSPSGFDLSSKTRSSSVAGPFLNPQPWCWKLFCTRMIIDDIWHHILEILRKTLQVGKFWPSFHIFAAQQQAHLRHGQSNELPPRSNLGEVVAIPGLPSIQTSHWHQPIYHNLFHYIPLFQVQKSPLSWELDAQNYVVSGNSMKLSYEDIASYVRW